MPDAGKMGVAENQLRGACADLDQRLRAGERASAEKILAAYPLLAADEEAAVELIYTEYAAREDLQQRPTPEEFYARFPHWKNRLQRQFKVHELLRENLQAETVPDEVLPPLAEPAEQQQWLGHYELLEEINRGGCGIVYKARQHGLDRLVAVKVLRPEFSRLLRARQRFCQEARVMAALRHPNIMPVHEIGESHGAIFFSMDFMDAGSWAKVVGTLRVPSDGARSVPTTSGRGSMSLRTIAQWMETVARAIHYAHQQGVIHRDLKPSNILFDAREEPVISDFGLATLPTQENAAEGHGSIVGTPAYMAPEQLDATGQPVTAATDIWALGIILYELLTGQRPFGGENLVELQQAVCAEDPLPFEDKPSSHHHERFQSICWKCLAKDPSLRFASAAELAEELASVVHGLSARPRSRVKA